MKIFAFFLAVLFLNISTASHAQFQYGFTPKQLEEYMKIIMSDPSLMINPDDIERMTPAEQAAYNKKLMSHPKIRKMVLDSCINHHKKVMLKVCEQTNPNLNAKSQCGAAWKEVWGTSNKEALRVCTEIHVNNKPVRFGNRKDGSYGPIYD